jgi:hypothetical protein
VTEIEKERVLDDVEDGDINQRLGSHGEDISLEASGELAQQLSKEDTEERERRRRLGGGSERHYRLEGGVTET